MAGLDRPAWAKASPTQTTLGATRVPRLWLGLALFALAACQCGPPTDKDAGGADTGPRTDASRPDSSVSDRGPSDLALADLAAADLTTRPDQSADDATVLDAQRADATHEDRAPGDSPALDHPGADRTVIDATMLDSAQEPDGTAPDAIATESGVAADAVVASDVTVRSDAVVEDAVLVDAGLCYQVDAGDSCEEGQHCCSGACVAVVGDPHHCGGCGIDCTAQGFCSSAQTCSNAQFDALCANDSVMVLYDGQGPDEQAGDVMGAALGELCGISPSVVHETDAQVLDQQSYQPLLPAGTTLLIGGGTYAQDAVTYLFSQDGLPIYDDGWPTVHLRRTDNDESVASVDGTLVSSSYDVFVLQVGIEPEHGALIVSVFGLLPQGTQAGAWYFANTVLPNADLAAKHWFVVEWTDNDGGHTPDINDSFIVLASSS